MSIAVPWKLLFLQVRLQNTCEGALSLWEWYTSWRWRNGGAWSQCCLCRHWTLKIHEEVEISVQHRFGIKRCVCWCIAIINYLLVSCFNYWQQIQLCQQAIFPIEKWEPCRLWPVLGFSSDESYAYESLLRRVIDGSFDVSIWSNER